MRNRIIIPATLLVCAVAFIVPAYSQSFRKGSILIGLTEGSTTSTFSTGGDLNPAYPVHHEPIDGVRDPLSFEYGISNHWGIGINAGGDIFIINPNTFYGTRGLPTQVKAITSEFTLDASYHFFVNQRNDLSITGSLGTSSVSIKGGSDDGKYQYGANGGILRIGIHARHYFCRRIGVLGMLTSYSSTYSPKAAEGNTFGNNYSTSVKGYAVEFGLCLRVRH